MGGMGFIQSNHSRILFNSTMISFNVRRPHPAAPCTPHPAPRRRSTVWSSWLLARAPLATAVALRACCGPVATQVAEAARAAGIKRIWYASSACIYPESKQTDENLGGASGLTEDDAWPPQPQAPLTTAPDHCP